jgi:hypothetical protein
VRFRISEILGRENSDSVHIYNFAECVCGDRREGPNLSEAIKKNLIIAQGERKEYLEECALRLGPKLNGTWKGGANGRASL